MIRAVSRDTNQPAQIAYQYRDVVPRMVTCVARQPCGALPVPTLVSPRFSSGNVLIYHPNSDITKAIQDLVLRVGHRPHVADTIGTAFEYADRRNPLALAMVCVGQSPHCTGLVWARTVRQIHPLVPIIVLASHTRCPDDESVTERLQLPFPQALCLTLLRRYLN